MTEQKIDIVLENDCIENILYLIIYVNKIYCNYTKNKPPMK